MVIKKKIIQIPRKNVGIKDKSEIWMLMHENLTQVGLLFSVYLRNLQEYEKRRQERLEHIASIFGI